MSAVASAPEHARYRLRERLLFGMILLFAFLAHARTLRFPFVYDDFPVLVENRFVQSWRYALQYFTMHVWTGVRAAAPNNYYRPLYMLLIRLDYALFGDQPAGWHLTAVLLHVAATALGYGVIRKVTGRMFPAAAAALFFAVHPVNVEVSTWVSAYVDSLCACAFLAALLCYLHSREESGQRWVFLGMVFYAAALLTKESAIMLPAIVFVHAFLYGSRQHASDAPSKPARLRDAFRAALLYVPVTVVYLVVRVTVLKGFAHTAAGLSPKGVFLTLPWTLLSYLRLLVFPVHLGEFYPARYFTHLSVRAVILPLVALLAVSAALWFWQRRSNSPHVAFAIALMVLPLLPLLNLSMLSRGDFVHDRYLYLPSLGFAFLLALALEKLFAGRGRPAMFTARAGLAAGCIAALFAAWTWQQSLIWASEYNLYTRGVQVAPDSALALNNLGIIYLRMGQQDRALELFQRAVQADPQFWNAAFNLGFLHYLRGNLDAAKSVLLRATQIEPTDFKQYAVLGQVYLRQDNLKEAAANFEKAISLNPLSRGLHFALGVIMAQSGDCAAAGRRFREEMAIDPSNTMAGEQLAKCKSAVAEH
jgi:tetratricopeptide (TPR) repeat protein